MEIYPKRTAGNTSKPTVWHRIQSRTEIRHVVSVMCFFAFGDINLYQVCLVREADGTQAARRLPAWETPLKPVSYSIRWILGLCRVLAT